MPDGFKKRARVQIIIDSKDDGKRLVMINSLLDFMKENGYHDNSKLKKRYPNLEYKNRKGFKDLRIFIVMDVDIDGPIIHDSAQSSCSKIAH